MQRERQLHVSWLMVVTCCNLHFWSEKTKGQNEQEAKRVRAGILSYEVLVCVYALEAWKLIGRTPNLIDE